MALVVDGRWLAGGQNDSHYRGCWLSGEQNDSHYRGRWLPGGISRDLLRAHAKWGKPLQAAMIVGAGAF